MEAPRSSSARFPSHPRRTSVFSSIPHLSATTDAVVAEDRKSAYQAVLGTVTALPIPHNLEEMEQRSTRKFQRVQRRPLKIVKRGVLDSCTLPVLAHLDIMEHREAMRASVAKMAMSVKQGN